MAVDHYDVVVVGSINTDLVVRVARHPKPGETLIGSGSLTAPGGKGANQAVAAARLGARVAMVGAVGSDSNAEVALSGLVEAAVDVRRVHESPAGTGLAVVTLADDGENSIVVVPGANADVTPERVEAARDVLAESSICVLQAEIPIASVVRAVELAAEAGTRTLVNVAPATALPPSTLVHADPLVVNEHEASLLLGHPLGESPGDASSAAAEFIARGVPSVVVTLGAAGVVGHDGGGSWSLPARPVRPLDTTGAGDAFVGALAHRLTSGATLEESAAFATRVAAASVLRLGAQTSYPWKGDPLP